MPLINRLLTSKKNIDRKNDCKLPPVDLSSEIHISRNTSSFGIDQIRILLFRECEWRGRRLIFDSITASKAHASNKSMYHGRKKSSHSRSGNGLKHENEQEICDNVNLLSEMVFGTVAMAYRGNLFKIHTLDLPSCIICTKVFPASDHDNDKNMRKISGDTLGISLITNDSRSSSDSLKNYTWSSTSSGNVSGNSLRKTSTCSSTCSGWDIDIPTMPLLTKNCSNSSVQSLESSTSTSTSGFSSLTSLRRRRLKAASTCLNWSDINQIDEIFGFPMYSDDNSCASPITQSSKHSAFSDICDYNGRRHRTRFGLTLIIKLTPEIGKEIELKLFEHAPQLEAILNRLCQVCMNFNKGRGLIERLHHTSLQCTCWLLRLLITKKNSNNFSLWHKIIFNKSIHPESNITDALHQNLDKMCQLFNMIDTKSTNFFLSTVITAVLTHHLGWINTVISSKEKNLFENMKNKYPCNPLWLQLNDLYGALGNPCKKVQTIVAGSADKSAMINAILAFLCYFIRCALVERYQIFRDYSDRDYQEAVCALEKHQQNTLNSTKVPYTSIPIPPFSSTSTSSTASFYSASSSFSSSSSSPPPPSRPPPRPPPAPLPISSLHNSNISSSPTICQLKKQSTNEINSHFIKKTQLSAVGAHDNYSIPSLKRTCSLLNKKCDELRDFNNLIKFEDKLPLKLDSYQDDLDDCEKEMVNLKLTNSVLNTDENNKSNNNISKSLTMETLEGKSQSLNPDSISLENNFDTIKQIVTVNSSGFYETNVHFSQIQYENNKEENQVFFTVGDEEKDIVDDKPLIKRSTCNCQCNFTFTRVPSTSAHLPEGVLRKILQRNFPESSKSIERPGTSLSKDRSFGISCPKCSGANQHYPEDSKLLLETPTNATEVLRTCGTTSVMGLCGGRITRPDSLEELLEVNSFIELPMPRSRYTSSSGGNQEESIEICGYNDTLLQKEISIPKDNMTFSDSEYMAGLILQGLIKNTHCDNKRVMHNSEGATLASDNWLSEIHDNVNVLKTCSFYFDDQPITEALCIVADVDKWQVGIISNAMPTRNLLLPVGMSRFVAEMLEAFAYLWTKYKSPLHCLDIIESKMRAMWLRSEALAEMIMSMDICNVNLNTLMQTLDLDAADVPLLLAVATTHSPQISNRIGFTYT